jgi:hypothetical protein
MREGHATLWAYPGLVLGLWLLSLVLISGGAWFIQEWRYNDLARSYGRHDGDRQIYVSNGQMQVVNGNAPVYLTSDGEEDALTKERRWRDKNPVEGLMGQRAGQPARNWGSANPPGHLPDIRPLQ